MNKIFNKNYIFIEQLNKLNKIKSLKLTNINIIIDINKKTEKSNEKELFIIKFARKNKIPFIIKNDYQKCFKYNANGIFLDSKNKNRLKPIFLKKKFEIIGQAHNQKEYFLKYNQGCKVIMLSPIFSNIKYTENKLLGILKFNLISSIWKTKICALGGINKKNLKKINTTKALYTASKSSIFDDF
jgi:thiamine-phosphate pyrophosphorylase